MRTHFIDVHLLPFVTTNVAVASPSVRNKEQHKENSWLQKNWQPQNWATPVT